jgi:hypothetical protein
VNEETGRLTDFLGPLHTACKNLQEQNSSRETGCDEILESIIIGSQDGERTEGK